MAEEAGGKAAAGPTYATPYVGWCGTSGETFKDRYDDAGAQELVRRGFLRLLAGIPCHDPRHRVFPHRDLAQREAGRLRWGATSVAQVAGRQVLVDGEQLRGPTGAGLQRTHNGCG